MVQYKDAMPPPKSIMLDACLAVGIAVLTAVSLGLAQEESYKYINPYLRFWLVLALGAMVQGLHALSKFRDSTFSHHAIEMQKHDAVEKTEVANPPPPVVASDP